ncbi:hypothetical protein SODG_006057 [Sodalis praecaptivus]
MSDKENYSEIRRVLSNIRSTRAFARETDFELLKAMHEKLGAVIEERRADAEKETAERALREEKRKKFCNSLKVKGLPPKIC